MFSCEYCEIFKNSFFIEHLCWMLLTPVRYPYVTSEQGSNKAQMQVKYTIFTGLRNRK